MPVEVDTVGDLPEYAQCGGMGGDCHNLPFAVCEDAAWSAASCSDGTDCERQNEYYWFVFASLYRPRCYV